MSSISPMRIQQQDSTRNTTKKSFVFESTNKAGLKKNNSFIEFPQGGGDKNYSPFKSSGKNTDDITRLNM